MQGIVCNQFISDCTIVNKERQKEMIFYLKVVWPKCVKEWEASNLMVLQKKCPNMLILSVW